jgi:hypothetical protein
LYDRLTVAEIGPAFLAAVARGDDVEQRRLFSASAKQRHHVSELTGWTFAVSLVAGEYRERQLESLAYLLFAKFQHLAAGEGDEPGDNLTLWEFIHDVAAYRFVVNERAWTLFRDQLRIGPDALPTDDPLFDLALANVPTVALTGAELLARHAQYLPADTELATPKSVADGWRRDFAALTGGG